jgi:hypothetical protein
LETGIIDVYSGVKKDSEVFVYLNILSVYDKQDIPAPEFINGQHVRVKDFSSPGVVVQAGYYRATNGYDYHVVHDNGQKKWWTSHDLRKA